MWRFRSKNLERRLVWEESWKRILGMLVTSEPLGAILEAVARAARRQLPGSFCVILVKETAPERDADFFVGAAPDVPPAWLAAIGKPETLPAAVRSLPVGDHGSILLLFPERIREMDWEPYLQVLARLAQIGIEHRRFLDQLSYQAHHDSLTRLPNRALLNDRLENAVMEAHARRQRLGLLHIDIDEFKHINERLSHLSGDAVLMEAARRLRAALRPSDTLARIGGDEFSVLLPDIADSGIAVEIATQLLESVRQPMRIDDCDLTVTVSIGLTMYPEDGQDAAALQSQADAAMCYAKTLGRNRIQAFSDNARILDSVRIAHNLRSALQQGWFRLLYQPKFTAGGELAGMEALIRLHHPELGEIQPAQFIPIAESTGLIVPIGDWVISEVCRQIAQWRGRKRSPVVIAVNVSAVQISRPEFAANVEGALAAWSIPPCCLELEVTESMVIDPESEQHRQMQLLRALGVSVSIDDFGTGFSSLSYLHRLKIDAVKLDRSFVQAIATQRGAQHLVRAMIAVAKGLGVDVIAEGVETDAQRRELVEAGCPVMQGFLFARPSPADVVEAFLGAETATCVG
ncbi:MAG TPA: EAL domain-containing protein [Bryobacteraceae bacterium]|nr:EAL domain-containing protein [Bryobacteraceae bacterium]